MRAVAAHLEHAGIASDLPHPRDARSQARDGVRGGGGAFRRIARHRRDSGEEVRLSRTSAATAARSGATWCWRTPACNISSRHYQKLVAKIEGKPEERILSYLMLRSLRQARYSTENVGHFALAARDLHAFHVADPALSGPDGAPPAARGAGWASRTAGRGRPASRLPMSARNPSAARPTPSANWWSGRRSSSWPTGSARISTR